MYQLLPINYIYQTNARFNVFIFQYETDIGFKIFKEQALKVALLLCNDYESCQAIAFLENYAKLKYETKKIIPN